MFLAFAGENYYPSPGVHDLVGVADTLSHAIDALEKFAAKQHASQYPDWAHIFDTETCHVIHYDFDSDGKVKVESSHSVFGGVDMSVIDYRQG